MFKEKLVLTFYAQTPVHMGSGTSVSYVDNPIQREKHTDFPILAGSGIKGVIRDLAQRKWDKDKVDVIFGPEKDAEEYASCVSFTDAKILLYPVRSVKGVFAYITCPYVLKRFKNELNSIWKDSRLNVEFQNVSDNEVLVCSESDLKIDGNEVALEEFVFNVRTTNQDVDSLAESLSEFLPREIRDDNFFKKHFAIVSDNVFRDFTRYAIEIRTRIRIDQTTGTVTEGALFTVELVPAESVFYGFVFAMDPYRPIQGVEDAKKVCNEMKEILNDSIIQLGGDETLGMGLIKVKIFENQRG